MTSTLKPQPDPVAVWLSHLLVGTAVGAVIGPRASAPAALLLAITAMAVHHMADAPVAKALSAAGV